MPLQSVYINDFQTERSASVRVYDMNGFTGSQVVLDRSNINTTLIPSMQVVQFPSSSVATTVINATQLAISKFIVPRSDVDFSAPIYAIGKQAVTETWIWFYPMIPAPLQVQPNRVYCFGLGIIHQPSKMSVKLSIQLTNASQYTGMDAHVGRLSHMPLLEDDAPMWSTNQTSLEFTTECSGQTRSLRHSYHWTNFS